MVFQHVAILESAHEAYNDSDDFIGRYIFQGRRLPTKAQLLDSIRSRSPYAHPSRLIFEFIEDISLH
jgi:cyclopropane fatty-acyl-phospholipid synthase-like methyltransferase